MSTVATLTAVERLAAVHPHHVERIEREAAARTPGTVLVTRRGEFYCGLVAGDVAVVSATGVYAGGFSVQAVAPGAHLHMYDDTKVSTLPVADWTYEQVKAGQAAAETYAKGLLERAYTSANRLLGGQGTDKAALEALREANRIRDYAFALGILATFIEDPRR